MSFLTRLFKKKADDDYETIFSTLAADIQKRQVQLSEIRLRERRTTLMVTLYTLAAWVAYVSMWYMNVLPTFNNPTLSRDNGLGKAIKGAPVVVGPIVILFIRRIVQIWYQRKGDAEEKSLQSLLKQQRSKVEEIKKKTNFYSTRDLIQKYDDSTPMNTPLRQRIVLGQPQLVTPQRMPARPAGPPNTDPNSAFQTPARPNPSLQAHLTPSTPSFATGPPRKQWYDKLADALLGDEETAAGPPSSRYALICEKCFAHNGLVKESMWEDAQYVCPKCNHFNASARSKKQGGHNLSPMSASTSPSSRPESRQPSTSPAQASRHLSPAPPSGSPAREQERDAPTVDGADASLMEVDVQG
ncbi:hypothetical protein BDQ12DRAFT_691308 [Crucibulum laeve]|uniref:Endoplasmic reticulum junction formation protein lunapark n=1 Tax=Crucibulum laeve TaxID=68775 RepID=A0A5C3LJF8_9AGAR|nr:hypothetical protein BDQ12DRAFT_691308 [Crucibulum laeve]